MHGNAGPLWKRHKPTGPAAYMLCGDSRPQHELLESEVVFRFEPIKKILLIRHAADVSAFDIISLSHGSTIARSEQPVMSTSAMSTDHDFTDPIKFAQY